MADLGWHGTWEPMIVDGFPLDRLKDLAGEPQLMKNGRINEWCLVNLRTGEFRYPARR